MARPINPSGARNSVFWYGVGRGRWGGRRVAASGSFGGGWRRGVNTRRTRGQTPAGSVRERERRTERMRNGRRETDRKNEKRTERDDRGCLSL